MSEREFGRDLSKIFQINCCEIFLSLNRHTKILISTCTNVLKFCGSILSKSDFGFLLLNSLVLVYYQRFCHNSTGMDCWKHYPWISAPKRIVKDGICLYDCVSVSVTITWRGNTFIALD